MSFFGNVFSSSLGRNSFILLLSLSTEAEKTFMKNKLFGKVKSILLNDEAKQEDI